MARLLLGALLLVGGCNVYDASLLGDGGGRVDAGPGGGDCEGESRVPPARPTTPDGPDGPEVIFALKDVLLDQDGERWREIGFNVDGLCSQAPDPQVECLPPNRSAEPQSDGVGGIDNAFGGALFPLVNLAFPTLQRTSIEAAQEGNGAIILRVRGWNGEANDPRVDVTVAQSVFALPAGPDDTEPQEVEVRMFQAFDPESGERLLPRYDGNDWFFLREDSFLSGDLERPRIRDNNAYVVDDQLVLRVPDRAGIVFAGEENGIEARITDGTLTGRISADRTRIGPVIIGGRWAAIDLIDIARSVGACDGSSEVRLLQNQLDRISDVRSTPGTGGPDVDCDAVSVGVQFDGFRGRIGGMTPGLPIPDLCGEMP